jgi:DNA-binding response OmpR family regulator
VNRNRRIPASSRDPQVTVAQKAVLVGDDRDWPSDLKDSLERDGYIVDRVTELSLVPSLLADGRMRAIFVVARPLAASDLLRLRHVRETSARTAIVVVTRTPTQPDLKRAFESGATAFLSWPASTDALRQAIESGDMPPPPASRLRP